MRDYGRVYTKFWTEKDSRTLSPNAKLLFIYLLTSPHTTSIGCFYLPKAYIAHDLGWDEETVTRTLRELETVPEPFWNGSETVSERFPNGSERVAGGFIAYCDRSDWVILHHWFRYNGPANPNEAKGMVQLIDKVPDDSEIFPLIFNACLSFPKHFPADFLRQAETVPKRFRNGSPTVSKHQIQNPDPEPDLEETVLGPSGPRTVGAEPWTGSTPTDSPADPVEDIQGQDPDPGGQGGRDRHQGQRQPDLVEDPVMIKIPLRKQDGEFAVIQSHLAELEDAYPTVDAQALLKHIRLWNLDNPGRRKTRSGIKNHIRNFFAAEQNKGARSTWAKPEVKAPLGGNGGGRDSPPRLLPESFDKQREERARQRALEMAKKLAQPEEPRDVPR